MFESWLSLRHAAAFFYCVTAISVAMAMLIVRSWLGLRYG
jgi:nitrogen fixation protein FixH